MSIVLKTDLVKLHEADRIVGGFVRDEKNRVGDKWGRSFAADQYVTLRTAAFSGLAMQMAIEEWRHKDRMEQYPEEVTPRGSVDWIEERAAANLARLMAGDSPNTPDSLKVNGEGNG